MVEQDQEQSMRWRGLAMRWRHLMMLFLLSILVMLLFYLVSPGVAAEPGDLTLEQPQGRGEGRVLTRLAGVTTHQAVQGVGTQTVVSVGDVTDILTPTVFLPVVAENFCEGMPLCNGDFETGDLSCWRGGGELTVNIAPGLSGYWSALLGSPNFQCWQGVPVGKAWLEQTFGVPSYGNPQLSFRYEMHTQHRINHDTFEVYLNGYRILRTGQTGEKTGCVKLGSEKVITGTCTIDMANPTDCDGNPIAADFACTVVTLRFENWNRDSIYYNTWTYVDDVEFTW